MFIFSIQKLIFYKRIQNSLLKIIIVMFFGVLLWCLKCKSFASKNEKNTHETFVYLLRKSISFYCPLKRPQKCSFRSHFRQYISLPKDIYSFLKFVYKVLINSRFCKKLSIFYHIYCRNFLPKTTSNVFFEIR